MAARGGGGGGGGRISKLLFSSKLFYFKPSSSSSSSSFGLLHRFSTSSSSSFDDNNNNDPPPNPIPNRPLRGGGGGGNKPRPDSFQLGNDGGGYDRKMKSPPPPRTRQFDNRGRGGEGRRIDDDHQLFNTGSSINNDKEKVFEDIAEELNNERRRQPISGEKKDDQSVASFLEKFNLNIDDEKNENEDQKQNAPKIPGMSYSKQQLRGEEEMSQPTPQLPPEDADEIFKKMKETGLIPNAVSMLDGLCKDGLVQEAMKLFGLMREKGTIPEVVIYTAVVEGFCKAQKLDDAKRIFRKMQNNGITPNAFSYTVLIQGLLCKGKGIRRVEDALDFCVEMLEASHSPNVATFVSLVDGFVTDKGVEEATKVLGILREKGFFVNDKSVRDYLDKNGPFNSLVWEAIFGKKSSPRSF